jgi:hypothetical protein
MSQSLQVWLCFAHFAPSTRSRPVQIGFVLHVLLPGRATPRTTTALPIYPSRPKFGFVLHNLLRPAACGGTKLGSFCTIGTGREWWNDRIVEDWVFGPPTRSPKLGLFCMIVPPGSQDGLRRPPQRGNREIRQIGERKYRRISCCFSRGSRIARSRSSLLRARQDSQSRAGRSLVPPTSRRRRRERPCLSYRRLPRPVCCAKTKKYAKISPSPNK